MKMPHPASLAHNAARFFTSLSPAPPAVDDEIWVDRHLTRRERTLWIQLGNQDRRHSVAVAQRFAAARPRAGRAEIAGAILHDVGKIECGLGTFGRVVATLVGPRTDRFRAYFQHEAIGARMAAAVGSDPVTVELIDGRGPAAAELRSCDHA
ncbi:MAG: hypothetical protein HKN44_11060 [Ilumatobacter sp.]|nr:hypothetical protein [Ilumatobacter sp.]